ncbi:MAG: OmpA family protein [Pseudomonadota bacterium]
MASVYNRIAISVAGFLIFGSLAVHGPFGAGRIEARLASIAQGGPEMNGREESRFTETGQAARLFDEASADTAQDVPLSKDSADASANRGAAAARSREPTPLAALAPGEAKECEAAINRALNGRQLTFRPDSVALSAADRALLEDFAREISICGGRTIIIEGHTDSTGGAAANLALSERRAHAVMDFLEGSDHQSNFIIRAYGETRPIASNRTREGQRRNRRIDFALAADNIGPE